VAVSKVGETCAMFSMLISSCDDDNSMPQLKKDRSTDPGL